MTWTDGNGVTHEVEPRKNDVDLRLGRCSRVWNVRTRCGSFGPIGARTSDRPVDCMTCLVRTDA